MQNSYLLCKIIVDLILARIYNYNKYVPRGITMNAKELNKKIDDILQEYYPSMGNKSVQSFYITVADNLKELSFKKEWLTENFKNYSNNILENAYELLSEM